MYEFRLITFLLFYRLVLTLHHRQGWIEDKHLTTNYLLLSPNLRFLGTQVAFKNIEATYSFRRNNHYTMQAIAYTFFVYSL